MFLRYVDRISGCYSLASYHQSQIIRQWNFPTLFSRRGGVFPPPVARHPLSLGPFFSNFSFGGSSFPLSLGLSSPFFESPNFFFPLPPFFFFLFSSLFLKSICFPFFIFPKIFDFPHSGLFLPPFFKFFKTFFPLPFLQGGVSARFSMKNPNPRGVNFNHCLFSGNRPFPFFWGPPPLPFSTKLPSLFVFLGLGDFPFLFISQTRYLALPWAQIRVLPLFLHSFPFLSPGSGAFTLFHPGDPLPFTPRGSPPLPQSGKLSGPSFPGPTSQIPHHQGKIFKTPLPPGSPSLFRGPPFALSLSAFCNLFFHRRCFSPDQSPFSPPPFPQIFVLGFFPGGTVFLPGAYLGNPPSPFKNHPFFKFCPSPGDPGTPFPRFKLWGGPSRKPPFFGVLVARPPSQIFFSKVFSLSRGTPPFSPGFPPPFFFFPNGPPPSFLGGGPPPKPPQTPGGFKRFTSPFGGLPLFPPRPPSLPSISPGVLPTLFPTLFWEATPFLGPQPRFFFLFWGPPGWAPSRQLLEFFFLPGGVSPPFELSPFPLGPQKGFSQVLWPPPVAASFLPAIKRPLSPTSFPRNPPFSPFSYPRFRKLHVRKNFFRGEKKKGPTTTPFFFFPPGFILLILQRGIVF
ncbi:unnamed protein product [Acanthosepion pharaonis]|uniref:Uncharacterized protein n=1 Tax=Acanthosepion pharaonis TaxID=158019 RepID=A0A812BT70_ACAPH|nr:unnamed protein product [Sepia pharaonis]